MLKRRNELIYRGCSIQIEWIDCAPHVSVIDDYNNGEVIVDTRGPYLCEEDAIDDAKVDINELRLHPEKYYNDEAKTAPLQQMYEMWDAITKARKGSTLL